MSQKFLTIKVDKSLKLDITNEGNETWQVWNGPEYREVHEPYDNGSVRWWQLCDNAKKLIVECTVTGCVDGNCGKPLFTKDFPLRPGTIVLSNLHVLDQKQGPIWASFRPLELRELMDRYGIDSIRRVNPNKASENYFADPLVDASVVVWLKSDGQFAKVSDDGGFSTHYVIKYATWAIVDYVGTHGFIKRVLYTHRRVTPEMEESFRERGVWPVKR